MHDKHRIKYKTIRRPKQTENRIALTPIVHDAQGTTTNHTTLQANSTTRNRTTVVRNNSQAQNAEDRDGKTCVNRNITRRHHTAATRNAPDSCSSRKQWRDRERRERDRSKTPDKAGNFASQRDGRKKRQREEIAEKIILNSDTQNQKKK